nr:reverse transcriptase domain-containing protein [Tanacetum cinerariifolium]
SNIELKNMFGQFMKMNTTSSSGLGSLPSNTVPNPQEDLKGITTRSGVPLARPSAPPSPSKEVDREPETITDQVLTVSTNSVPPLVVQPSPASTSSTPISFPKIPEMSKDTVQPSIKNIQPSVAQTQVPIDEPVVTPKPKLTIPYPSRANRQKLREKDDNLALKFVKIFRKLHFELSFADALLHMPKFALMFKSILNNKEKLFDLATNSENKNCSAVILKKLPEKLEDSGKFLIPCDFPKFDECLALADLGASINLMPLSIWKKLSLSELTSTQMILELVDRSTTRPASITEDVFVKVGNFHFLTDFVVVDYVVDPHVPLILGRPFLRTRRALIDVYGDELTIRVDDEAITFKVCQTSKYSYNDVESINRIDVIDVACEEYVQELKDEEKSTLLKVLKSHKRAIAWKISDIKGIDPHFCTHKILMEDDFKPTVQHQRRVNPKIHEVIKKEVIKLLDAGLIYPISDSPWVIHVHCVPKKGGMTVVENEDNEIIPTRHIPKVHDGHLPRYDRENDGGIYGRFLGLENPHQDELEKKEITETFPLETLEKTIGKNHASWSDKLDDALWAFRTAFKTPIGCTLYKLVYRKACHLPIKLKHKAYWALKHCNFDLKTEGDHRKVQLNELNELRDKAYDNSLIYKEKTKNIHDSKIKNRVFNVGDRVFLFNSRLKIFSGKLKTHWTGPFTVAHVFPYGTIELSQADGPNFKVNSHRLKHYFGGDIPQLVVPDLQTFPMDQ